MSKVGTPQKVKGVTIFIKWKSIYLHVCISVPLSRIRTKCCKPTKVTTTGVSWRGQDNIGMTIVTWE